MLFYDLENPVNNWLDASAEQMKSKMKIAYVMKIITMNIGFIAIITTLMIPGIRSYIEVPNFFPVVVIGL